MHMLFAQITDIHITMEDPSPFANRCPQKQLQKIIAYLNALTHPPLFVFITGDCVHNGKEEEYGILRECLSQLRMPYYIIPGNHDSRSLLRRFFPEIAKLSNDDIFIQFSIEDYPVRLIGIDSVKEKAVEGELCEARLRWLDSVLGKDPKKPTILFMHHPPILSGIDVLDKYAYQNIEKLGKVLKNHPQVKHIFCGHAHRAMQSLWEGIVVSVVGSTVMQFSPDFGPDPKLEWSQEPGAFALHWWQPDKQSLITQFCGLP
jgi:3',5'-cyclic-AMP phosphodiesterase